ncbi:MAG: DUF1887 family protein [Lachnospiraceae bacterium]|nr:DUF1887 family protein [Lachnospiraceae bacterium]
MNVNIEFLDKEPIENMITSLHFCLDKIVFFGYHDEIIRQKEQTRKFLRDVCGVADVSFFAVSQTSLKDVLKVMREQIGKEYSQGSTVYFDLTGGESLILVAFGMLAKEFDAPLHQYLIKQDRLVELTPENVHQISRDVKRQEIRLNLDQYISMQGGEINHKLHKGSKDLSDEAFRRDIRNIWKIAKRHETVWNAFSEFLPKLSRSSNAEVLEVRMRKENVHALLREHAGLRNSGKLDAILEDCAAAGVLSGLEHEDVYSFIYKSKTLREVLWEAGSILELHTYLAEEEQTDDCMVGVHLDWDGRLHEKASEDVYNEIDVLTLRGYIPTFISCKSGNVNQMALYELETVASRFGGKYAKKVLVAPQGLSYGHRLRAQEMGIIVKRDITDLDEEV